MSGQGVPHRYGPLPHGGLPVSTARGQANLAEDDVDHRVDQVVLVGDVAVERHGRNFELLAQAAHGEGFEPAFIGSVGGRLEHPFPAETPPAPGL